MTDKDLIERDTKLEQDGLGSDGYLIITQDDIVDGIASYMARYISSMPQTKVTIKLPYPTNSMLLACWF